MNKRFLPLCAAVLICVSWNASAAPQMLPGGDPVVPCVPPAIRFQLEDWKSKNYPRTEEFYSEVLKAITCILKASPLTHDKNGFTVLRLMKSGDEATSTTIGLEGIGPHWVRVSKETNVLGMQGGVYIGGDLRSDCTWEYGGVTESLKNMFGKMHCIGSDGNVPVEFEAKFSKAWLEVNVHDLLEDILGAAIRVHESRYQER